LGEKTVIRGNRAACSGHSRCVQFICPRDEAVRAEFHSIKIRGEITNSRPMFRLRSVTKSNTVRGFRYGTRVDSGTHRKRLPDQLRIPPLILLPRSAVSQFLIDPVDLLQNLPSPRRSRWKVYGTRPTTPILFRFGEEQGRIKDILRIDPNGGREEPETAGPQAERKNEKATKKKRVGMMS
jgi:hypothetical protein